MSHLPALDDKSNQQPSLFNSASQFLISWRETTEELKKKVCEVYQQAGFSDEIVAIHQPSGSAELNSQNFKLTLSSGKTVLLRRCQKFSGQERYQRLHHMFTLLRQEGVLVPEFYSIDSHKEVLFFETDDKASWVFFKYIEAQSYFSGKMEELKDAALQLGKMHICLQTSYGNNPVIPSPLSEGPSAPFLPLSEWNTFLKMIQQIPKKDEYDNQFLENREFIEKMITIVEKNYHLLKDAKDIQNIHLDLNSTNFLVNNKKTILMDFDNIGIGNVYTDIAFAFHRLLTTCIEQGEKDIPKLIQTFLASYKKGNSNLSDFNLDKLIIAAYDRALRNIKANLSLKYTDHSEEWLTSIPINIKRLKQVEYLANEAKRLAHHSTSLARTRPKIIVALPKSSSSHHAISSPASNQSLLQKLSIDGLGLITPFLTDSERVSLARTSKELYKRTAKQQPTIRYNTNTEQEVKINKYNLNSAKYQRK